LASDVCVHRAVIGKAHVAGPKVARTLNRVGTDQDRRGACAVDVIGVLPIRTSQVNGPSAAKRDRTVDDQVGLVAGALDVNCLLYTSRCV